MDKKVEKTESGSGGDSFEGRRGKRGCPPFKGDSSDAEDYEMWKKRIDWWVKLDGKDYECPGGELLMTLGKKAFECVYNIDLDGLSKEEGVEKILTELDKRYGKEKQRDRYDKILEYFYIKRNEGESMREYVGRYELIEDKCKKAG